MTPLKRFEAFDAQIDDLLSPAPHVDTDLPRREAAARYFADLATFWRTRQRRLAALRWGQLQAELALRLHDKTLETTAAALVQQCLQHPLPWQRQAIPVAKRVQVYRPSLQITRPNWRSTLPGAFVMVAGSDAGRPLAPDDAEGPALLCSLSHGIESFASLGALHVELCERLDDPVQSAALLRLCLRPDDAEHAQNAERLRYLWFSGDWVDGQVQAMVDAQQARLRDAWQRPDDALTQDYLPERVASAFSLSPEVHAEAALRTRYGLLLEAHSPAWLRSAPPQAMAHTLQTMQELVVAIDRAAAPGIPSHTQFLERHALLEWTRARLRRIIRRDQQIDIDPTDVYVSVTMARQVGPVLHPGLPNGYVPVASRSHVGGTIELVTHRYRLEELALLNIAWLDIDYWLTARVHRADGSPIPELTPTMLKQQVRALDIGSNYDSFLRTHLITSSTADWRKEAHARITKARMRLESAKARYAGHFLDDRLEQGYLWAQCVTDYPDDRDRPEVAGRRLCVRQVLIDQHTVQGVLLVTSAEAHYPRFLVYAPDAPDRRPWREYRNTRELMRDIRTQEKLRTYILDRVPLADRPHTERLLSKGGLAPRVRRPAISGDFQHAGYLAEVNAVRALVDASTSTRLELLGDLSLHTLWLTLDLISLALPNRALSPLAFGRAAISVLQSLQALATEDRVGALKHFVEALTHTNDGINSIGGSTVVRRAFRALPTAPPLQLPTVYVVKLHQPRLHYHIGGIQGAGVYEQKSKYPGLSLYYIQDHQQRFYQVAYDGYRWRAIDPRQPDAYFHLPVKQLASGEWVIDSPVLWYDGLPDLARLLDDCRWTQVPSGHAVEDTPGLYRHHEQLYLLAGGHALPVRPHLLAGHYHLLIPGQPGGGVAAWAIFRWQDGAWRLRVRQAGRSSAWTALPTGYEVVIR